MIPGLKEIITGLQQQQEKKNFEIKLRPEPFPLSYLKVFNYISFFQTA